MAALPQTEVKAGVGTFRTFGRFGPLYEVLRSAGSSVDGKDRVLIRVLATGETLEYKSEEMLADPEAE